ncbi:MAG: hypothetical protein M1816_004401 [Peltula sp. TS41687]|nr:MAG: hypothetical protein M1816_004401 [Peltula sp. TS41687]
MPLILSLASPADASRIAEIHMAAFGSNAMLRAQFPTPAVRDALQSSIEWKALADIKDPKTTVLVVRDSDQIMNGDLEGGSERRLVEVEQVGPSNDEMAGGQTMGKGKGKVIAFAKWAHPVADDEEYVEPPWAWPQGTDWDVLEKWSRKMEEVQERVLGRTSCYRSERTY